MCYYKEGCGCEEGNCGGRCVDVAGCCIADGDDCCTTEFYTDGDDHCDGGCCGGGNNCHCDKCCGNEDYHIIGSRGGSTPDDYYA